MMMICCRQRDWHGGTDFVLAATFYLITPKYRHGAGTYMVVCLKRERVLVYLTTHGYVRRVSRPPTAAYTAGVVGE
jgi:hypothetical protein